jgi:hypothetical protein
MIHTLITYDNGINKWTAVPLETLGRISLPKSKLSRQSRVGDICMYLTPADTKLFAETYNGDSKEPVCAFRTVRDDYWLCLEKIPFNVEGRR